MWEDEVMIHVRCIVHLIIVLEKRTKTSAMQDQYIKQECHSPYHDNRNSMYTWGVHVLRSPNFFLGNGSR